MSLRSPFRPSKLRAPFELSDIHHPSLRLRFLRPTDTVTHVNPRLRSVANPFDLLSKSLVPFEPPSNSLRTSKSLRSSNFTLNYFESGRTASIHLSATPSTSLQYIRAPSFFLHYPQPPFPPSNLDSKFGVTVEFRIRDSKLLSPRFRSHFESPRYWPCDSKPLSNFVVVIELRNSPSHLESSNRPLEHLVTSPLHHLRLISASPSSYIPVSNTLEPLRTPLRTSKSGSSVESCFELRISPSNLALLYSRRTPLTSM